MDGSVTEWMPARAHKERHDIEPAFLTRDGVLLEDTDMVEVGAIVNVHLRIRSAQSRGDS